MKNKTQSNSFSSWILLIIIFIIAFSTNPNISSHQEEVKDKLNVYLEKAIKKTVVDSDNEWSKLGEIFGTYLGNTALDEIVKTSVSSDNYMFFSTTKFNFLGKKNVIGIGVFGKVFIFPEFDKELDNSYNEIFK